MDLNSGFYNLFKSAMRFQFSSQVMVLWQVGVHVVTWCIQQTQNNLIFKEVHISIFGSIHIVCQSINEAEFIQIMLYE